MASLLTVRRVRDRDLAAVGESCTARVEETGELLLHRADQLDQATQPSVVLRLVGEMRKPARQETLDEAEELPV